MNGVLNVRSTRKLLVVICAGVGLGLMLGSALSNWAQAQQPAPQQQSQMSPADTIAALRSMVDTYKTLTNEANERVASVKADRDMLDVKNKSLQAELDKLKADPPKAPDPK